MSASGRMRTLKTAKFYQSERPLLGKADICLLFCSGVTSAAIYFMYQRSRLADTRRPEEDPGIWTETVARDGFSVEPAIAQMGNRAMPAPGSHCVHVEIQELIRFCGGLLINAAAQHHTCQATLCSNRTVPMESCQNDNTDDASQSHRNHEVGIDEEHDPGPPKAPACRLSCQYTSARAGNN